LDQILNSFIDISSGSIIQDLLSLIFKVNFINPFVLAFSSINLSEGFEILDALEIPLAIS